jgi:hypothetical protein
LDVNLRFGDHTASFFRIEERDKQKASMKEIGRRAEDGGYMFLRNVGILSKVHKALYSRGQNSSKPPL